MTDFAALPPFMSAFFVGTAFVFGACFGSFFNVVIARVPVGASIVWPPSHCMSCGKGIEPFHNVPILSWFLLRGRCSNCRARFSFRYAFIELLFALVCAFAVARHGVSWAAASEIVLMGFLIPLAAIDFDTYLLPHSLTLSGIVVGLLLALPAGRDVFLYRLLAAAVGYTSMLILAYLGERAFGKEALGGGDLCLMGMIGAFLGLRALLPVVLLSSLQGSVIGILMIVSRRRRERAAGIAPAAEEPEEPAEEPKPEAAQVPAVAAASSAPGTAVTQAAPVACAEALPASPKASEAAAPAPAGPLTIVAKAPEEDDWVPDPTSIPFGPFLALAAAEVLYFTRLPDILFPWPF
jgi:leader peptidase (prepilin peptidase)/N-methyltransferase